MINQKILRKISLFVLALLMMFSPVATLANTLAPAIENEIVNEDALVETEEELEEGGAIEETPEKNEAYVAFVVELNTLGEDFLHAPALVSFEEGDTIISAMIRALGSQELVYIETDFGPMLTGMRLSNRTLNVNIPQIILDATEQTNEELANTHPPIDVLGSGNFHHESGWMFTANNAFLDGSAWEHEVSEGDVIRLQFSIYGWGVDIGVDNSSWGGASPLLTPANRDALITAIATINSANNRSEILAEPHVQVAYDAANEVLTHLVATQTQVDDALATLETALAGEHDPVEVDRNELNTTIAAVLALDESDYTPASWSILQGYLTIAITLRDDADATQGQIDEVAQSLRLAIEELVEVNNDAQAGWITVTAPANSADMIQQIREILVEDFDQTTGEYDYSVVRKLRVIGNVGNANLFIAPDARLTIRPYVEVLDLSQIEGISPAPQVGAAVTQPQNNYTALRHVYMPGGIPATRANMFAGSTALETVTFVGDIPNLSAANFFAGAHSLWRITFEGENAPTITANVFNQLNSPNRITAFVPNQTAGGYETNGFSQHFLSVVNIDTPAGADRSALTTAIDLAEDVEIPSLVIASRTNLVNGLNAANMVLNHEQKPQASIDASAANLTALIGTLQHLDPNNFIYIQAPHGTTVGIFNKPGSQHFTPFHSFVMTLDEERSDETYDVWQARVPAGAPLHIEAYTPGETIKVAQRVNPINTTNNPFGQTIVVDPTSLDEWIPGRGTAWHDANLLTNLDDSGALNLTPGDVFYLDTFRVWQAMSGVTSNYFIEPEFIFDLIGDSVSIERVGTPGREQLRITALEPGQSVIGATFNPIEYIAANGNRLFFDAIDPRNTLAVPINVSTAPVDFETGMAVRNDFDTYYFDQNEDYRRFTFTPASGSTVRVHDPLNISTWGEGWTTYTANPDGSFEIELREGRNIVEITNNGQISYQVIRARGVEVTIHNLDNPGQPFRAGERAQISILGLTEAIEKLAGIYNPGFGAANAPFIWYENAAGGRIESNRSLQYQTLTTTFTLEYTLEDETLNELNGAINVVSLGSPIGAHRHIAGGGTGMNLDAVNVAGAPFGGLPIIVLPVVDEHPPHAVVVEGGTGDGYFAAGSVVTITATVPEGQRFMRWTSEQDIAFHNETASTTTFTMPDSAVTVTAHFEPLPTTPTPPVPPTPGPSPTPTPPALRRAPNPRTTVRRPGLIRNNNVALRHGPGTVYEFNRNIARGQVITVLNEGRNGWHFVQVGSGSMRGWVRSRDITATTTLATVRNNRVALRARANGGATLTRLRRNVNVTILATNANRSWTQIRVGHRTGWVRTNQLRTVTPSARTRRQINLQTGPGSNFGRISNSRVNRNARVRVLGRQGNWSRIRIGSRTGWVRTNQLRR